MCAEFVQNDQSPDQHSGHWSPALDPAQQYLDRLGEGSRRTMREALSKLAGWASDGRCNAHELPWELLRIEHTLALRTRLENTLAPATANKHLAALRGVLKECWQDGVMPAEAYQRAIALPPVKGSPPRKTHPLSPGELERLTQTCGQDPSPAGARDGALLALLYGAQLRRSEAVSLAVEDYDAKRGRLQVRSASSGRLQRFAANDIARIALERWLAARGNFPGALFNPINKGGRIEKRHLSEQAIYIACQKRAGEAGLRPISPEDLRRAAIDASLPAKTTTIGQASAPPA